MAVTAPIESEMQQDTITVESVAVGDITADDIDIISDDAQTNGAPFTSTADAASPRDPVMLFVYLGILTLLAIIATSAFLAL
jgi:hypothetical protein